MLNWVWPRTVTGWEPHPKSCSKSILSCYYTISPLTTGFMYNMTHFFRILILGGWIFPNYGALHPPPKKITCSSPKNPKSVHRQVTPRSQRCTLNSLSCIKSSACRKHDVAVSSLTKTWRTTNMWHGSWFIALQSSSRDDCKFIIALTYWSGWLLNPYVLFLSASGFGVD